jgi:hypothetical protein
VWSICAAIPLTYPKPQRSLAFTRACPHPFVLRGPPVLQASWQGDGFCDAVCNTAACNFDNNVRNQPGVLMGAFAERGPLVRVRVPAARTVTSTHSLFMRGR